MKKELYIFLHIPKTGGTSFKINLQKSLKKNELLLLYRELQPELKSKKATAKFIKHLSQKKKDKLKVIFGHKVYYGIHKYFPDREIRYITFFREPQQLAVSRYNYLKTLLVRRAEVEKKIDIVRRGKILGFSDFIKYSSFCRNPMYDFLFNHGFGPKNFFDCEDFTKIKSILDNFYFVGLTEKSDEDFLFLSQQIGLDPLFLRFNKSKKFLDKDTVDFGQTFKKQNKIDFQLYQAAVLKNQEFKGHFFYRAVKSMKIKRKIFWLYFLISFWNFRGWQFIGKKLKAVILLVSHKYIRFNHDY